MLSSGGHASIVETDGDLFLVQMTYNGPFRFQSHGLLWSPVSKIQEI